jgi:hypothetical protein
MATDDKSSSSVSSIARFKSRHATAADLATAQLETDPWEDILAGVKDRPALAGSIDWEGGEQRVSSKFLLTGILYPNGRKMRGGEGRRLAKCMRKLGWWGPRSMRIEGGTTTVKGYWRRLSEEESNARNARIAALLRTPAPART